MTVSGAGRRLLATRCRPETPPTIATIISSWWTRPTASTARSSPLIHPCGPRRAFPTKAVLGFTQMLRKVLREEDPTRGRRGVRRPGAELPPRDVRRLQGDAGRPARGALGAVPHRARGRGGAPAADSRGRGCRSGRRDRHPRGVGARESSHHDRVDRQGPDAARGRSRAAPRHHQETAATGPRRWRRASVCRPRRCSMCAPWWGTRATTSLAYEGIGEKGAAQLIRGVGVARRTLLEHAGDVTGQTRSRPHSRPRPIRPDLSRDLARLRCRRRAPSVVGRPAPPALPMTGACASSSSGSSSRVWWLRSTRRADGSKVPPSAPVRDGASRRASSRQRRRSRRCSPSCEEQADRLVLECVGVHESPRG